MSHAEGAEGAGGAALPDGSHEGMCVDADDTDGGVLLSIVLVAGEHKGEVVELRATGLRADTLDLLGTPCTVHVAGGVPRVEFD